MRTVHHCKVCGFLSTHVSEFVTVDGVKVDRECADRIVAGDEVSKRWLSEAMAKPSRPKELSDV